MTGLASDAARIEASGWGWRYPERRAWAVRGLDLVVEAGERVAVVGLSGAGKSTFLRGVAGVLADDVDDDAGASVEGSLAVGGMDPRERRGRVGLVMQDPEAHTVMSRVGDDVAFGCENTGVAPEEIWPRVREALRVVGLDLPLDRSTAMLSGGQRQRLALAGVLAMRPGVLVLDEPCANLDPDGVREVRAAVEALLAETGATLLVVEHRIGTWLDLVDRMVLLEPGGGVVADGPPAAVVRERREELAAAGVWLPGARMPSVGPARVDATPGPALLSAEGLAVARGSGAPAAAGIDAVVRSGAALAVTGPNGAGKSTLGWTLGGLLRPAGGRVVASERLAGRERTEPCRWSSRALAARIGSVFQNPEHAFLARSVRGELLLGPLAVGFDDREASARAESALHAFGLAALADENPFTLSGGEQRRLAIAAAAAASPPVLILDEPTSGQDAIAWRGIAEQLARLMGEGAGVVAITHDRELVDALGAEELMLGARSAA